MVWRDRWDGAPNVVVLAEPPEQDGALYDALLLIGFETPPATVSLTTRAGDVFTFTLPELSGELPELFRGIDLTPEPA